jgi:hypothetical protein
LTEYFLSEPEPRGRTNRGTGFRNSALTPLVDIRYIRPYRILLPDSEERRSDRVDMPLSASTGRCAWAARIGIGTGCYSQPERWVLADHPLRPVREDSRHGDPGAVAAVRPAASQGRRAVHPAGEAAAHLLLHPTRRERQLIAQLDYNFLDGPHSNIRTLLEHGAAG